MKNNVGKRILLVVLAMCAVLGLMAACKKQESDFACTMTIDCGYIWDHEDDLTEEKAEFVPEDGLILDAEEVYVMEGDTAYDLLVAVCDEEEIHLDSEKSTYGQYVKGIGQIYGGDCGEMSGWMFKVNGEYAEVGCDAYKLAEGDEITWVFVCDWETDY